VITFIVVTVLLAGAAIPSSRPAWVSAEGYVYAPVDPIVRTIAQTVELAGDDSTITIAREGKQSVLRAPQNLIVESDGTIYVKLGPVVRELGGSISFDAVRKVVTIVMPADVPVNTPTPFNPSNPTVAPTMVFTPQPTVTPRPTPTGIPQPRRTPLPVVPSYP
jgi:hypothetical protein